jgi:hypothetical protein
MDVVAGKDLRCVREKGRALVALQLHKRIDGSIERIKGDCLTSRC